MEAKEWLSSVCDQVRNKFPSVEITPRGDVTTLNLPSSSGSANISATSKDACVEFSSAWCDDKGVNFFRMPKEYSLNSEVAKDAARDIVFFLHPSIYMMQTYKLKGDGYAKYEGNGTQDDTVRVRRLKPNGKGSVDLGNVEEVKFIDLEPIS